MGTDSARPRRLLLLATEFPPGPGGIGTHAFQLALHSAEAGWDVTVLAPQEYVTVSEAEAFDVAQPFTVVRMETQGGYAFRNWKRLIATARLSRALDPAVIVGSGNWAVWLSVLGKRGPAPTVAVAHGVEFGRISPSTAAVHRLSYGRAAAVVCVSEYTRRRMLRSGVGHPRIEVFPNGADHRSFGPDDETRRSFLGGRLENAFVLLTVGNVTDRKGQDVVVRALPDMVQAGVDAHYVVVGLATRALELAALAHSLGVAERVHILGRLPNDELRRAYQSADVFAMTSREAANGDFEGYGIAVLEAALCSKPAIVTGGSGLEEAVVADRTGLVIGQDDAEAFARAALRLAADPELRRGMGASARQRVLDDATWEIRTRPYLRLFAELAAGRVPRPSPVPAP